MKQPGPVNVQKKIAPGGIRHAWQGGSPGSPVGVEPLDQHSPEPVHNFGAQAARLLDLSGELYGKHVGLEAHPAFLTLLDLAVQFIDEIL
jgi:hypothetical protein